MAAILTGNELRGDIRRVRVAGMGMTGLGAGVRLRYENCKGRGKKWEGVRVTTSRD